MMDQNKNIELICYTLKEEFTKLIFIYFYPLVPGYIIYTYFFKFIERASMIFLVWSRVAGKGPFCKNQQMVLMSLACLNPFIHMVCIRHLISQIAASLELEIYKIGRTCKMHIFYFCGISQLELNFMYCVYWKGKALCLSNFLKVQASRWISLTEISIFMKHLSEGQTLRNQPFLF